MTENHRIEYKRELTDNLEKEVVAFLNAREGGVLHIGIDDDGKTIGVQNFDQIQLIIKDRLRNNIRPSIMGLFEILHEKRDGKDTICLTVAGGLEKPYYLKKYGMTEKGCYLRIGSASEPMPQEMIEAFYGKRIRNTIGRIESPRHELTFEQLKIYYDAKGLHLNNAFMKNLELLTPEGKPNYAAYLLADENSASFQIAKYAGTDRVDLIENRDYGRCSLIKALKAMLDRVNVENTVYTKIGYPLRKEREMIDSIAMREAIINAVAHNDYSYGATPKVEFFADRVEVTSMGGLPYGVTEKDFFGGYSVPRNKELMRVLRDLEIVEHLGSGVPRILKAYGQQAFEIRESYLRVIFPYAQPIAPTNLIKPSSGLESGPESGPESIRQRVLQELARRDLSKSGLAQAIGQKSVSGKLNERIREMLADGLIEYTIPGKPSSRLQKYRITGNGRALLNTLNKAK